MKEKVADFIGRYLPYLRRFSRALNGTQERGDAYVVAMLEALIADQGILNREIAPKLSAYQLYMRLWNSIPANQESDAAESGNEGVVDRHIETLTPRPRQAFLLAALEQFSPGEVAVILETGEDEVHQLLDTASREIGAQLATRVLIIEDEPIIALELERLVKDIGHEVAGIAATKRDAIEIAQQTNPGLVLADIQLGDGSSGIEAANEILEVMELPWIFITAYPERLLTGERVEPTFIVHKPFKPEMVKALISQALFFEMNATLRRVGGAAQEPILTQQQG